MCKEMCKDTVIQYLRGFTPGLSGYDSNMNRHVTDKHEFPKQTIYCKGITTVKAVHKKLTVE